MTGKEQKKETQRHSNETLVVVVTTPTRGTRGLVSLFVSRIAVCADEEEHKILFRLNVRSYYVRIISTDNTTRSTDARYVGLLQVSPLE